jgi:hypothetical protein
MRRIALGAALAGFGVLVARAVAPRVHARLLAACERMFEEMPDTFPPKRMMRGIEEISANSARTLELLEQRTEAGERELLVTPSSNKRIRRSPRPVRAS